MEGMKTLFFALVFLIIVFFGMAIGFWVGSTIENLPSTGVFTSWELLKSPVKFIKISDASSDGVWAQTIDNKLYFWGFGNLCSGKLNVKCLQWVETANVPSNAHKNDVAPMSKGKDCPKKYPGEIAECIFLPLGGPGFYYFALLKDGTLWEWSSPSPTDVPLLSMFICPSIGLLLGIVVAVALLRTLQKRFKISIKWQSSIFPAQQVLHS
jgi:hypothetical protein